MFSNKYLITGAFLIILYDKYKEFSSITYHNIKIYLTLKGQNVISVIICSFLEFNTYFWLDNLIALIKISLFFKNKCNTRWSYIRSVVS